MKNKKYLYLIRCSNSNFYKVGSSENPEDRLRKLQVGCPYPLSLIYKHPFKKAHKIEKFLHKKYSDKRKTGEWFELSGTKSVNLIRLKSDIELMRETQVDILPNYIPMLNEIRTKDSLPPIEL